MKPFGSLITELFDKSSPYRLFSEGNGGFQWNFLILKGGGDTLYTERMSAKTDAFIEKHGLERVKGYQYEVEFEDVTRFGNQDYADFLFDLQAEFDITPKGIYEMSFGMRPMEIVPSSTISWGRKPKEKWSFMVDAGTEDDINIFDQRTVSTIFSTIMDISREFLRKEKPKAVIFGTKVEANPSRAKIYANLSKRLSREFDAEFRYTNQIRPGVANSMMAVFPKNIKAKA